LPWKGGGKNLYRISIYGGKYHAEVVQVGFITNSFKSIGSTRRLEDALSLIKSDSVRI
jgi:hypothetical protein